MANNTVFFPGYSAGENAYKERLLSSVMKFLSTQQRNIWMKQHRTVL